MHVLCYNKKKKKTKRNIKRKIKKAKIRKKKKERRKEKKRKRKEKKRKAKIKEREEKKKERKRVVSSLNLLTIPRLLIENETSVRQGVPGAPRFILGVSFLNLLRHEYVYKYS